MNKWSKVIVGGVLLGSFVFYTQYEKNAEPVWKVNKKEFSVVGRFQDGMNKEYNKFEELAVMDRYNLLQKSNKSIPLEDEMRMLRIERIWNMQGHLYVLYSVDLKERDKDERDVPSLLVKKIRLSNDQGKELTLPATNNNTSNEGFVYKHRLYRSTFIIPQTNEMSEETWRLFSNATRYELLENELISTNGKKTIKKLIFKVSSDDISKIVLEKFPINKKFTYGENKEADLKSYDVLLNNHQISLDIKEGDDLVGFTGWYKEPSNAFKWDLFGTEDKGYNLFVKGNPERRLVNEMEKKTFTLVSSLHRETEKYIWEIPKEDIEKMNVKPDEPIKRNEIITTAHKNMTLVYEGLTLNEGVSTIQISMKQTDKDPMTQTLNSSNIFSIDALPEEYNRIFQQNLLSITGEKKNLVTNYQLNSYLESEFVTRYYINFYQEENNGPGTPTNIPEEDLTITISDLVYSIPLPSQVTIPYKIPKLKKPFK